MRQIPLAVKLKDSATFGTYCAGPNGLAVAYLKSLVERGIGPGCWLWGGAGCGKSHLLQALCGAAAERDRPIAYLPMTQIGPMGPGALEGWSDQEIVAVDDIDTMVGDADLEGALFRLYNDLAERSGALVVASDAPPSGLDFTLPDLRSRLVAGAVFHLAALDEADAIEALQCRADYRGLELPDDTARFLLRRVPRDMGSLCDWLDRLDLASLAAKRRLTVPFVRDVLAGDTD